MFHDAIQGVCHLIVMAFYQKGGLRAEQLPYHDTL